MQPHPVEQPDWSDTRVTIVVCVAAFGLSVKYLTGHDLEFLILDPRIWPGEPWRLLTACLLHVSALHLMFNLYWVWRFGNIIEPIFGLAGTAALLIFLGAGSMAAEWAFLDGGIGLSGVGYGMWGLLWALDRFAPNYRGVMTQRTSELFAIWFLVCIALTLSDVMPVANIAHGVGALLGALVGVSLPVSMRHRSAGRVALALGVLFIAVTATWLRPVVNMGRGLYSELFQQGYAALEAGDYDTAARVLERAVELRPDDPGVWNNLAIAYLNLGRHEESERAFERRNQVDPSSEATRRHQAWTLWRDGYEALESGELDAAIELLERSVELDAENAGAWDSLARAYDQAGRPEEAGVSRRRTLELMSD